MRDPVELMHQVIKETHIIKRALESGDLEVAISSLAKRADFIDLLLGCETAKDNARVKEMWQEYQTLDADCRDYLDQLGTQTREDAYKNRSQKMTLYKTRQAHYQYHMGSLATAKHIFDEKK